MSASVHTTMSPRACWLPMRRTVPEPLLCWNAMIRMFGKRGSASRSRSSVASVEQSSMASSS
jgi:hypothetical protein